MYHALYRKYRPVDFDSVVGQNTIIKTLKNSIKNKSFSHAYMFFGPRGVGKTTISKIFARSVNCLSPIDGAACGKCDACINSFEKECVDIIEIDAASNNSVDEIRDLKSKISLVPAELKYKVYIIDEVHMLSISAFNALLKTLEEPPEHAIFILATTDPQKVPETIVSRCQCFNFKRISENTIVSRLKYVCQEERIDIDDTVLFEIAISSEGGMRDSLGLLDKLHSYNDKKITLEDFSEVNGTLTRNDLEYFCSSIFNYDIRNVLSLLYKYNDDGKNLIQIMNQIMFYLRDLLVKFYVENISLPYDKNLIEELIYSLNDKIVDIKKSGNTLLFVEIFLLNFINISTNKVVDKNISQEIINNSNFTLNKEYNDNNANKCSIETKNHLTKKSVEKTNNILNSSMDSLSKKDKENNLFNEIEIKPSIININEIIDIRINNTMAKADKSALANLIKKKNLLSDYTFDQEIGYIVCTLLDGNFRAASSDNVIISYQYDSVVKQNLADIKKITEVFNNILDVNYKLAIVSEDKWVVEKNKYIENMKNNSLPEFKEEPLEVFEDIKKDDIISSSAIDLFGDIVELR